MLGYLWSSLCLDQSKLATIEARPVSLYARISIFSRWMRPLGGCQLKVSLAIISCVLDLGGRETGYQKNDEDKEDKGKRTEGEDQDLKKEIKSRRKTAHKEAELTGTNCLSTTPASLNTAAVSPSILYPCA